MKDLNTDYFYEICKPKTQEMSEADFKNMYLVNFIPDTEHKNVCGECIFFDNGCTTSQIERKYGNRNTPSCTEFAFKPLSKLQIKG